MLHVHGDCAGSLVAVIVDRGELGSVGPVCSIRVRRDRLVHNGGPIAEVPVHVGYRAIAVIRRASKLERCRNWPATRVDAARCNLGRLVRHHFNVHRHRNRWLVHVVARERDRSLQHAIDDLRQVDLHLHVHACAWGNGAACGIHRKPLGRRRLHSCRGGAEGQGSAAGVRNPENIGANAVRAHHLIELGWGSPDNGYRTRRYVDSSLTCEPIIVGYCERGTVATLHRVGVSRRQRPGHGIASVSKVPHDAGDLTVYVHHIGAELNGQRGRARPRLSLNRSNPGSNERLNIQNRVNIHNRVDRIIASDRQSRPPSGFRQGACIERDADVGGMPRRHCSLPGIDGNPHGNELHYEVVMNILLLVCDLQAVSPA